MKTYLHIHVQFTRTVFTNDFIAVLQWIGIVWLRFVFPLKLLVRQSKKLPFSISNAFVGEELWIKNIVK